MLYIDPKDQPIQTKDNVLSVAWLDRCALKLQQADLKTKITALDVFIDIYIKRAQPIYGPEQVQFMTPSTPYVHKPDVLTTYTK